MAKFSKQDSEIVNEQLKRVELPKIVLTKKDALSKIIDFGRQFCYGLLECALYPMSYRLHERVLKMYGLFSYVSELRIKSNRRLSSEVIVEYFITGWIEFPQDITRFAKKIQAEHGYAFFVEQVLFEKIEEFKLVAVKIYSEAISCERFLSIMQEWLRGIEY